MSIDLPMLSVPDISRRLRVKSDKVRAWIRRGELVGVNLADRLGRRPRWRVAPEELDRFLRARQSVPAPVIQRAQLNEKEQAFFRQGRPVMAQ